MSAIAYYLQKLVGLAMLAIGQLWTDSFSDEGLLIDLQLPAVIPKGATAYRLCRAMRGATIANGAPDGNTL
jgi:hypothetical protein